jgi:hypothetical protein
MRIPPKSTRRGKFKASFPSRNKASTLQRERPSIRCALAERLCSAAYGREPGSYGVADGDAAGEGDASASVFFLVEDFFVVVDFFVAGAVVVDFFLVVDAASELVVLVVVIDSFLLAHDVIKPTAARTAMDVISDCFISCG